MSDKIYVLDEIAVLQAGSASLRQAYVERYAPGARARGMHLEGAWRSPPIEIPGRATTLHFLWSVPDVAGWWRMRLGAARADAARDVGIEGDEEKIEWWSYVDSIAISRKRSFLVDMRREPCSTC